MPEFILSDKKRQSLLMASSLLLVLSFSSAAWGTSFRPYSPETERKVGTSYTIKVQELWRYDKNRLYPRHDIRHNFLKIDLFRRKETSPMPFFTVSCCIVPEYQSDSKSIFLRVKHVPVDWVSTLDDLEKRMEAFNREKDAEFIKLVSEMGWEKANENIKPYYDYRDTLFEERQQVYENALVQIQRQDWSYYIINKADAAITDSLSERAFLASKAVEGKVIHWTPAPRSYAEYNKAISNSCLRMRNEAIVSLCLGVFVFFIFVYFLILGIIYVFRTMFNCLCKKKRL